MNKNSANSHWSLLLSAAGGCEAGGPSRAHIQTLLGGGQERQRGSVIRGLPVSHAQGDPPASQLGMRMPLLLLLLILLLLLLLLSLPFLVRESALSFFVFPLF